MDHSETTTETLDLHGFRLEPALRRLVELLERHRKNCYWSRTVCVITGTGSHSHDGPVLRTAVERFLKKRSFQYIYKTGSFYIQPHSGTLTHSSQSSNVDSKVILTTDELFPKPIVASQFRSEENTTSNSNTLVAFGPSLQEVARAENELSAVKEASLQEFRTFQKETAHEKNYLKQAIERSKQDEQAIEEEKELFQRALEASKEEDCRKRQLREQEERWYRQALEQSEHDHTENDRLEQLQQQEEEKMLETALKLSIQETVIDLAQQDDDLQLELRRSLQQQSDDWIPQEALQNSLSELQECTTTKEETARLQPLSLADIERHLPHHRASAPHETDCD